MTRCSKKRKITLNSFWSTVKVSRQILNHTVLIDIKRNVRMSVNGNKNVSETAIPQYMTADLIRVLCRGLAIKKARNIIKSD